MEQGDSMYSLRHFLAVTFLVLAVDGARAGAMDRTPEQTAGPYEPTPELIVDRMLEDNKVNEKGEQNVDIVNLMNELQGLRTAYSKIIVQTSAVKVEPNEQTKVTTLKSQTKITVTPEAFTDLRNAVNSLRTNFIL